MEFEEGIVVSTPQGNKSILSTSDLTDILDANGLHDISEVVSDNLNTRRLEVEAELSSLQDEFDSYEFQNEEYHDCIVDTANSLEEIINSINDSKRLNRLNLVNTLTDLFNRLWSVV